MWHCMAHTLVAVLELMQLDIHRRTHTHLLLLALLVDGEVEIFRGEPRFRMRSDLQ